MIQNPSDGEFLVVWDDDIVQSALGNSCFKAVYFEIFYQVIRKNIIFN